MFQFSKLKEIIPNASLINFENEINFEKIIPINQTSKVPTISFINSKKYLKDLEISSSKAFIAPKELESFLKKPTLIVENIDLALVYTLNYLYPAKKPNKKIGKYTIIEENTYIGENVEIGNFVSIGKNVKIGDFSIIKDGVKIDDNVIIKKNAKIGFNTTILKDTQIGENFTVAENSTLGSDGFRFVFENKKPIRVAQVGRLIIGNNVEIQANCCIDKGGLGDTIIGDNCKLDNLVHIAHNCILGKNVIITAECGVAGSTTIGDNVIVGGATAISDHLQIASNVIIAGGSVIRKSILEPGAYASDGSLSIKDFQKYRANLKNMSQLNKWFKKITELEDQLQEINARLN